MTMLASQQHGLRPTTAFQTRGIGLPARQHCRCRAAAGETSRWSSTRRSFVAQLLVLPMAVQGAQAVGLESLPPQDFGNLGDQFSDRRKRIAERAEKDDAVFENSDILRTLREKSDANRDKNKRALQDRYCYRQAELGVGDCAGLRLIPGATNSGKQATPGWLRGVLEKLGQKPMDADPSVAGLKPFSEREK